MATLDLATVELVSTLRAAPQNGSPSSQDYNDSWSESLADLAALSGFVNDIIVPMLNGLSTKVLPNPNAVPNGLEGRYVFSDTSDLTSVFFDSLSAQPLSVADSLRILNGIITTVQSAIANLNVEVTALQTQLSSTNQNDVAQALQNFAASLQALTAQTNSNTQQLLNSVIEISVNNVDTATQNKLNLKAGSNMTITAGIGGDVTFSSTGGGGGGTVPRTTTAINTGSLGNNVAVTGSVSLAPSIAVIRVNTNFAARIQLYTTAASRDTAPEPSRPISIPPTPGLANGIIFDLLLNGLTGVPLNFPCSPTIAGSNQDVVTTNTFYWRITNLSGATQTFNVILTYLPTEA